VIECEHLSPWHSFNASIAGRSRSAATSISRTAALRRIFYVLWASRAALEQSGADFQLRYAASIG
jgi:hypothetical protein